MVDYLNDSIFLITEYFSVLTTARLVGASNGPTNGLLLITHEENDHRKSRDTYLGNTECGRILHFTCSTSLQPQNATKG